MKRCYLCMLSTLEDGQLAELSALMVIPPLQQPLVQWLSQRHRPPKTMWAFSCKLHAVVITATPADAQMSGTAFPYSHFRKTQPARSKSNKIPQNGGVWGFLEVEHHPLKKRFSVLEAEKWLAAEGSLHPKHNNPCESSYFGNELSDQTQKQQGNFHTNVIVKLQHRWYKIPQIPVEIFQYISLR